MEKNAIVVNELDLNFRDEVASQPGGENIKRCFACGTCAAGCPITEIDEEYNSIRAKHGLKFFIVSIPISLD